MSMELNERIEVVTASYEKGKNEMFAIMNAELIKLRQELEQQVQFAYQQGQRNVWETAMVGRVVANGPVCPVVSNQELVDVKTNNKNDRAAQCEQFMKENVDLKTQLTALRTELETTKQNHDKEMIVLNHKFIGTCATARDSKTMLSQQKKEFERLTANLKQAERDLFSVKAALELSKHERQAEKKQLEGQLKSTQEKLQSALESKRRLEKQMQQRDSDNIATLQEQAESVSSGLEECERLRNQLQEELATVRSMLQNTTREVEGLQSSLNEARR